MVDSVKKKLGNITVEVDYRTELLGVIQLLSDYHNDFPNLFQKYANKYYVDRINDKFLKYKDDEVITMFNELYKKHRFCYDGPITMFLELDEHLKCNKLSDYVLNQRLNGDIKVYELIYKLEDFAKRIEFDKYYLSNKEEYEKYIESQSKPFEMYDVPKFLKSYYGYEVDGTEFFINMIPFMTNGAYGSTVGNKIYSSITINENSKEDNLYDTKEREKYFTTTPVHEFSHSYVNPITKESKLINEDSNMFDDIKDIMKAKAYTNNETIINEHIIRAINIRYIDLNFDEKWTQDKLDFERNSGFIYIDNVLSSLKEYEENRDIHKTFDSFYPIIINNMINEYEDKKNKKI